MARPTNPKAPARKRSWTRTPPPEHTPSTREWVELARKTLIEKGIAEVKIDRLARQAGVTRGGFYWRFKSRDDLLDALIEDWKQTNTVPILAALGSKDPPFARFQALAQLYIEEKSFSPGYDTAVRSWASSSPKVAAVVRQVDAVRISAIQAMFRDAGFAKDEALIRARITYFHQVGYYTVGILEPKERRRRLSSLYLKVLSGFD